MQCYACEIGFFNANGDERGDPNCQECGLGCSECEVDASGAPFCLSCDAGWNLNENFGYCFSCDPKCSSCLDSPDNCDACVPPYILEPNAADSSIHHCVVNTFCYSGCNSCSGM